MLAFSALRHTARRAVRTAIGSFPRRRDGTVAVIFGLALVPIALAVGGALDYSRASDTQIFLATAADAAALSAVTPGAMTLAAKTAEAQATALFNTRAAQARFASNVAAQVKVQDSGNTRTATVTFSANVDTVILRLAGWSTVPVGGNARAASAPPTYIDFHILLDNTPSMGLGATQPDIDKMVANTSDKCAFACHDLSAGGKDYYALAKKLGVTMRIDMVRSATQQLTDTATSSATVSGQYRMALGTFGTTCGGSPALISGLTSNLSAVRTSASAVDLMTTQFQGYNNDQCSDFNTALTLANLAISAPGDGTTSAAPQKVLFFVSDGVSDGYNPATCAKPTTSGRCQEPINTAYCQTIKSRGIKIAILYTTYLPLPTNDWYNTWIKPFQTSVSSQMESCASAGLFFEVTPSDGISDAMTALFKKSVAQARLSM